MVVRGGGQQSVGILKGDGADAIGVGQGERLAALGAGARAIPHAGVARAAGGQPAAVMTKGELAHRGLIAAHVEFLVLLRPPEMHGVVLRAGHEPAAVGRPDQRGNRAAIGVLTPGMKIVRVPQAHAAEVRHGDTTTLRMPRQGGQRLWRVFEGVRDGTVPAQERELSAGCSRQVGRAILSPPCFFNDSRRVRDNAPYHRPPRQVLDPGGRRDFSFNGLPAGVGIPEPHATVLSGTRQEPGGQRPEGRGQI